MLRKALNVYLSLRSTIILRTSGLRFSRKKCFYRFAKVNCELSIATPRMYRLLLTWNNIPWDVFKKTDRSSSVFSLLRIFFPICRTWPDIFTRYLRWCWNMRDLCDYERWTTISGGLRCQPINRQREKTRRVSFQYEKEDHHFVPNLSDTPELPAPLYVYKKRAVLPPFGVFSARNSLTAITRILISIDMIAIDISKRYIRIACWCAHTYRNT